MSQSQSNPKTAPAKPAPLACLECRRKHLKCDGGTPVCGRCIKAQTECQWAPSRRGYKPGSKPGAPSVIGSVSRCESLPPVQGVTPILPSPSPFLDTVSIPEVIPTPSLSLGHLRPVSLDQPSLTPNTFPLPDHSASLQGDGYLFDFYYTFFHDAHPILPPIHLIHRLAPLPACLQAVLKFTAAHFIPDLSTSLYRETAVLELKADTEPSCYHVQALLIFSIVLHARNERSEAVESFTTAVDLALRLGMNREAFALSVGGDDPVRTESIRRTWWELYMTDSMFAAFDHMPCKIANNTTMDVKLPCDELSFAAGVFLTEPPTITDFYNRLFANQDRDYGSYCYAIEATRILKRTLDLVYIVDDYQLAEQVESIDAAIAAWFHHLPDSKKTVLTPDGSVDQVLFRAHMAIHCASIYLHLPRSHLLSTPTAMASIPCARRGLAISAPTSNIVHAAKCIKAANDLAGLAALRSPVLKNSPFFICGLVIGAIVQLCACSVRASSSLEPRRDRLALTIGQLKSLNPTWAISRLVMRQIKIVAREVLEIGVQPPPIYPEVEDQGPDISTLVSNELWLGDIPIEQ